MKFWVVAFFLLGPWLVLGESTETKILFVAHRDTKLSNLTLDDVRAFYRGRVQFRGQSEKIKPCFLSPKTPVGKSFFESILQISPAQFNKLWMKRVLSGYGASPQEFKDADKLLQYIDNTPGAIGFIPPRENLPEKNIRILKIAPAQKKTAP